MAEDKNSLLSDTKHIPNAISVYKLLESRGREICNLQTCIELRTGTKLIFQRLPRHMRRRTMSHNVKRLPRRIREAHLSQMKKSGMPPKSKSPSRKFRRRPKNLLNDYNRRQKEFAWLETHIWHAKRFRMINRWGFRLPDRPCDKAFRACYRAGAKHCLLQDISYISLIELSGPEELLMKQLKTITSPNTGLTIGARAYKNGAREGETVIYHKNQYPFAAIGSVKFIWKPAEQEDSHRSLWIWVHAAYYNEVSQQLIDLFNLTKIQTFAACEPTYMNNFIILKEYKHYFNRFKLTGPLSHSVLKNALKLISENNTSNWLQHYLQSPQNKASFIKQSNFWNSIQNINTQSELSPHIVLNLIISDPRYSLPHKRTKAMSSNTDYVEILNIPEELKFGAIWHNHIRKEVSETKLSTAEVLLERGNRILPDHTLPLNVSAIPVMLIQQPGNRDSNLGYCSGWDIIAPLNWGRSLWLSCIMWGARAGGLRETDSLKFEQGIPDILEPDTEAGENEEILQTKLYKTKFFMLPPNKRVNFNKMGIVSPFKHPWKILIKEWNHRAVDKFYVLRDKKKLKTLQELLKNKNMDFKNIDINFNDSCIVPVRLTHLKKGRMKKFSIICLPAEKDLKNDSQPVEPAHTDHNEAERKNVRIKHLKLLKKLRRKRVRDKTAGKEIESTKELVLKHNEKMQTLWLPEPKAIRKSCSRQVVGFVTKGDFSFSRAKGQCIGYVALSSLPTLLNTKERNLVLLRDTCSRQYRFARIEIICT